MLQQSQSSTVSRSLGSEDTWSFNPSERDSDDGMEEQAEHAEGLLAEGGEEEELEHDERQTKTKKTKPKKKKTSPSSSVFCVAVIDCLMPTRSNCCDFVIS